MSPKALAGLKILDFGQIVSGGHLSAILADFGAEVVKVESLQGESLRQSGPFQYGQSTFFNQENRGKKSLSIDLKKPEACDLIKRLIPQFDVIIENFRPGTMAKFGLDYEACRAIKEDIIYLSISGFGQNNSRTLEPAYDVILQAASGLARQTGTSASGPLRVPASIADYSAALNGAVALLAAVRYHDCCGQGQYIDVSMYDGLLAAMDNSFTTWQKLQSDGVAVDNEQVLEESGLIACGTGHPGTCPHGYYPSSDGGYIAHMSLSEKMWQSLCAVIGRDDLLADAGLVGAAQRRKQRARVDAAIAAWTSQHTVAEIEAAFTAARLPVSRVRSIAEAYADPYNEERGIFAEISQGNGRVKVPNFPARLSVTPAEIQGPAPDLGQHSVEILQKYLQLDETSIADLQAKEIIK